MIRKILINIILTVIIILIAFLVFEIYCFQEAKERFISDGNDEPYDYDLYMIPWKYRYRYFKEDLIRPIENKANKNLAPIVIFGCSYAFGDSLEENQTFSYYMGQYTKHPVYNFSYGGWSIANALYIIENDIVFRSLSPAPEKIIYVYAPVQLNRMYLKVYTPSDLFFNVQYVNKNGKMVLKDTSPLLFSFYSVKKINEAMSYLKIKNRDKTVNDLKIYFEQAENEIKKLYPDTDFYILVYENNKDEFIEQVAEETDWKVIYINELTDINLLNDETNEYFISEKDYHPNEKVWSLITKPFMDKIGI